MFDGIKERWDKNRILKCFKNQYLNSEIAEFFIKNFDIVMQAYKYFGEKDFNHFIYIISKNFGIINSRENLIKFYSIIFYSGKEFNIGSFYILEQFNDLDFLLEISKDLKEQTYDVLYTVYSHVNHKDHFNGDMQENIRLLFSIARITGIKGIRFDYQDYPVLTEDLQSLLKISKVSKDTVIKIMDAHSYHQFKVLLLNDIFANNISLLERILYSSDNVQNSLSALSKFKLFNKEDLENLLAMVSSIQRDNHC